MRARIISRGYRQASATPSRYHEPFERTPLGNRRHQSSSLAPSSWPSCSRLAAFISPHHIPVRVLLSTKCTSLESQSRRLPLRRSQILRAAVIPRNSPDCPSIIRAVHL
eukprot:scaffold230624_cov32-Tisochrysis_lutea.AAC.1